MNAVGKGNRKRKKMFLNPVLITVRTFVMNSSIGIATGYGLDDRCSIPGRDTRFSLLRSGQTGSGVNPLSYLMATGFFPEG
jgi:hypothetical protein